MPTRTRNAAPAQVFDYTALGDAETVARDAAGRIAMRRDAETEAKSAWIQHSLDLLRVRKAAKHGHYLAWLKHETPFTERVGQLMASSAAMIVDHLESENFSGLPQLDKAVTYSLAAPSTPETIRAEFLPRLLAGERGLRKLVNAALKPEASEPAQDQEEAEAAAPVPSRRIAAVVDHLPDGDGRAVLALITEGETEALRRALEWRFSAPAVPRADRIREHARAAAAENHQLDLLAPGVPALAEAVEAGADDPEKPRLH